MAAQYLQELEDVEVVLRDSEGFLDSIERRCYNPLSSHNLLPDAACFANSVEAVQRVVQCCSDNNCRVSIRSGGNSWHHSWLHGSNTVLLDVGDINGITLNDGTLIAGPGAMGCDIVAKLPDWFFPCGHCPPVTVGGFVLGGGYGVGFTKYGLTSASVTGMEVVLASGEILKVKRDDVGKKSRILFDLLAGSYSGFPAVITKYEFQLFQKPTILDLFLVYDLKDYLEVLTLTRDIQHRGDKDAESVETTMKIGNAPSFVLENTGVSKAATLSLSFFGNSEQEVQALYDKYVGSLDKSKLVVPAQAELVSPKDIVDAIGGSYPTGSIYHTCGFLASDKLYKCADDEVANILQPVVEMWQDPDAPPAPSHSLIVPMHPQRKEKLVFGSATSMCLMSYVIHPQDSSFDYQTFDESHKHFVDSPIWRTHMPEGHVKDASSCFFNEEAYRDVIEKIQILDPHGLFCRFHGSQSEDT